MSADPVRDALVAITDGQLEQLAGVGINADLFRAARAAASSPPTIESDHALLDLGRAIARFDDHALAELALIADGNQRATLLEILAMAGLLRNDA